VHRAIQAGLLAPDGTRTVDRVGRLLRDEERLRVRDIGSLVARAMAALDRLAAIDGLADLLSPGNPEVAWCRFEVPFAMRQLDGRILRGTIDCVVCRTTGLIEVLEFKTGRPDPVHEAQVAHYVAAVQALFPGTPVSGRLVYAEGQLSTVRRV
jgi:hypothetical protein